MVSVNVTTTGKTRKEEKPKCQEGFKWDEKSKSCIPIEEKPQEVKEMERVTEVKERAKKLREEREAKKKGKDVVFIGGSFMPASEDPELFKKQQAEREGINLELQQKEDLQLREQAPLIKEGLDPLIAGLEERTLEPLELAPSLTKGEATIKAGLDVQSFVGSLFGIETTEGFTEEFAQTGAGKVVGSMGIVGLGLGLAGLGMVGKSLASGIAGKGIGSAGGVLATMLGIKTLADFRGGEIDKLKGQLSAIEGSASSLSSGASAGADPNFTLEVLQDMDNDLNQAEIKLKELGEQNIDWRVSKEYREFQEKIRTTRLNLLERARTTRNLAVVGTASPTPETYFSWFNEVEQNNPQFIKDLEKSQIKAIRKAGF